MLLTVILIIISFPSPNHSFTPCLKHSFSAKHPFHRSLSFSSSGLTTRIPQTLTVTSEHIRFYFLVFFLFSQLLVVVSMRYIKLTHFGFRAHVKIASRIVSYGPMACSTIGAHRLTPFMLSFSLPRIIERLWLLRKT